MYDQNKHINQSHVSNLLEPNMNWTIKLIRALWNFSQTIWKQRCKHVHIKHEGLDESLCADELKSAIKSYLKLPREELSHDEKQLHLNVSRHIKKAYHTTLTRWLRLLAKEREKTIRMKRESRRKKKGQQPLERFFRPK